MVRAIVYILATVFLITVIRAIVGIVFKGFGDALKESSAPASRQAEKAAQADLKKDPVCGTYVPAATSLKLISGGETYFFCSPGCRDKFQT